MARITLYGVPSYVTKRLRIFWRQSWTTRIWQLFLIVVGGLLVYGALSSAGVLIAAIAGIVVFTVLADDIRAVIVNIWRRNWAEVSVNL